jgi:hypothetical protein
MSAHGNFGIETIEIGRGLWHARVRRSDQQPIYIDGVAFRQLDIGYAWPSTEAAAADARRYSDRMSSAQPAPAR